MALKSGFLGRERLGRSIEVVGTINIKDSEKERDI